MTSTPLKQKRKKIIANYLAALLFGLATLILSTALINYGLIPMLPMKGNSPDYWIAISIIAGLGLLTFELAIHFQINYAKVIEHRKQFYDQRKQRPK